MGRMSRLESWESVVPLSEERYQEAVLEPGDVLCLPPGARHEASAVGVLLPIVRAELNRNLSWRGESLLWELRRRKPRQKRLRSTFVTACLSCKMLSRGWMRMIHDCGPHGTKA